MAFLNADFEKPYLVCLRMWLNKLKYEILTQQPKLFTNNFEISSFLKLISIIEKHWKTIPQTLLIESNSKST